MLRSPFNSALLSFNVNIKLVKKSEVSIEIDIFQFGLLVYKISIRTIYEYKLFGKSIKLNVDKNGYYESKLKWL
jgi:hypothetical protein